MTGVVVLGLSIIMVAVLGFFAVSESKKAREYKENLRKIKEDVDSLCKTNRDLTQHNQDLNNALNTNSKVLDERAAAVLDMKFKAMDLERNLDVEKKRYANLIHHKKSSEVRVGLISEQIAPFLDAWPFDVKDSKFIGAPIDVINFGSEEITIVEIKTGKAKLSPKQRQIKKQIKEKKIKFMEFRIEEDGFKIKTD